MSERSPRARLVLYLLTGAVVLGIGLVIFGTSKASSDSDDFTACQVDRANEQYLDSVSDLSGTYMATHQDEMAELHAAYMGRVFSGAQPVYGCSLNEAGKQARWAGIALAVVGVLGSAIVLAPGRPESEPVSAP